MMLFKKPLFFLLIAASSFTAFTTFAENQRIIEGRIMNETTNEPIATEIVLYRNGQAWHVKSTDKGWYSISLPSEHAYAVKIYNSNFKKHVSAFYLDPENSTTFEHDIKLAPNGAKSGK